MKAHPGLRVSALILSLGFHFDSSLGPKALLPAPDASWATDLTVVPEALGQVNDVGDISPRKWLRSAALPFCGRVRATKAPSPQQGGPVSWAGVRNSPLAEGLHLRAGDQSDKEVIIEDSKASLPSNIIT